MVLSQYEFARYDYGRQIDFKIYEEDGTTAFDASNLTGVAKGFKRHGDRAFFFRDVARALTVLGSVSQIIGDIAITWDTQASGIGHFAFTANARPSINGYLWIEVEMVDSPKTKQISTELVRVFVTPSESA